VNAYLLEDRFEEDPETRFSVEAAVGAWIREDWF
jgi:hypothetical protein